MIGHEVAVDVTWSLIEPFFWGRSVRAACRDGNAGICEGF